MEFLLEKGGKRYKKKRNKKPAVSKVTASNQSSSDSDQTTSDDEFDNYISILTALRANPDKKPYLEPVWYKIDSVLPDLLEDPQYYKLPIEEFKYVTNVAAALSDKQNQIHYFGEPLSSEELYQIFYTNRANQSHPRRETGLYNHAKDSIWDQVEYWSNRNRDEGASKDELKSNEVYRLLKDMFDKDLGQYKQLCREYGDYLEDGKDTHGYLSNILSGQLRESSNTNLTEKENALLLLLYNAFQTTVFRGNLRVFLFNYADALLNKRDLTPDVANKILKLQYNKNSPWRRYISS